MTDHSYAWSAGHGWRAPARAVRAAVGGLTRAAESNGGQAELFSPEPRTFSLCETLQLVPLTLRSSFTKGATRGGAREPDEAVSGRRRAAGVGVVRPPVCRQPSERRVCRRGKCSAPLGRPLGADPSCVWRNE
eukprot:4218341-Pyramimonas_sp.AAC.1